MQHAAAHSIGQIDWRRTWRHVQGVVVFLLIIAGLVMLIGWLGRPPQTQAAAEAQLERPVMAFALWDDTPYAVFEFGDSGHVYLDRMRIDWISIAWPPTPRWQFTGSWSYIDTTTAPASAGLSTAADRNVVFGQVNTPEIITLELEIDGAWRSYPVSSPGYAVRLAESDVIPTGYRWLDAEGRAVYAIDEPSTLQP